MEKIGIFYCDTHYVAKLYSLCKIEKRPMRTSLNRHLWYGWLRDRKPWPVSRSRVWSTNSGCCTQVWSLPSQSVDKERPQKREGGGGSDAWRQAWRRWRAPLLTWITDSFFKEINEEKAKCRCKGKIELALWCLKELMSNTFLSFAQDSDKMRSWCRHQADGDENCTHF